MARYNWRSKTPMASDHPKEKSKISIFLKEEEFDMIGIAETNICWPKVDPKDRL